MKNKLIYTLDETDVETVSMEVLGRRLSHHEMSALKDKVAKRINWFDAIECAIQEVVSNE